MSIYLHICIAPYEYSALRGKIILLYHLELEYQMVVTHLCGFYGLNSSPVKEQQVLLIAESSFQSQHDVMLMFTNVLSTLALCEFQMKHTYINVSTI